MRGLSVKCMVMINLFTIAANIWFLELIFLSFRSLTVKLIYGSTFYQNQFGCYHYVSMAMDEYCFFK